MSYIEYALNRTEMELKKKKAMDDQGNCGAGR
jgi:hypothetical protein